MKMMTPHNPLFPLKVVARGAGSGVGHALDLLYKRPGYPGAMPLPSDAEGLPMRWGTYTCISAGIDRKWVANLAADTANSMYLAGRIRERMQAAQEFAKIAFDLATQFKHDEVPYAKKLLDYVSRLRDTYQTTEVDSDA
jgi:hypothetical protein